MTSHSGSTVAGELGRRVARGSVAIASRQALIMTVSLCGGIVLARQLVASQFGAYALLILLTSFGRVIIDGGLTASLIRQKHPPTYRELNTLMTVQLVLAIGIAPILCAIGFWAGAEYVDVHHVRAMIILGVSALVVTPLISISVTVLERDLEFKRVANILTVQPLSFNLVSMLLVSLGAGEVGLGVALLASYAIAAASALRIAHYHPRICLDVRAMKGRLSYGLPIVGVSLISVIKDSVNPLFIGLVAGAAAAGYVNWAQQISILGMYLVATLSRVLFPAFSRLAREPDRLKRAISDAIYWANAVAAVPTLFILIYADALVPMVYGSHWSPALSLVKWLLVSNIVSATSAVLLSALNAIGKPQIPLTFSLVWFLATWIAVPPLVNEYGFIGYGYANAAIQCTTLMLFVVARRHLKFKIVMELGLPWLYALGAFLGLYVTFRLFETSLTIVTVVMLGAMSTIATGLLHILCSPARASAARRSLF